MGRFELEIFLMSENAILINWPQRINVDILDDIIAFTAIVRDYYSNRIENYTPAYTSLLIQFNDFVDLEVEKKTLKKLYIQKKTKIKVDSKIWEIPVCYDRSISLDVGQFEDKGIDHNTLVELHTEATYRVYMIGFLPGFLYLGGLPKELHLPRKSTPNLKTPKGAIAIGGEQTGIYPMESPGGWHVIGQTPLSLFDINKSDPTPIRQGDIVKFYKVSLETFQHLL